MPEAEKSKLFVTNAAITDIEKRREPTKHYVRNSIHCLWNISSLGITNHHQIFIFSKKIDFWWNWRKKLNLLTNSTRCVNERFNSWCHRLEAFSESHHWSAPASPFCFINIISSCSISLIIASIFTKGKIWEYPNKISLSVHFNFL